MKKNILHQIFGYLLILLLLLVVSLIVNKKGMFICFIMYLIIIIFPVIKLISSYFKVNKTISKKEEELINLELSNNILFEGRDYTLTLNYFIDNNNFNFIKYEDILINFLSFCHYSPLMVYIKYFCFWDVLIIYLMKSKTSS